MQKIYVNVTGLVIPTGVPSVCTLVSPTSSAKKKIVQLKKKIKLDTNPSCPVQVVTIELEEYEAYEKGFPYVSSLNLSDSIFRQTANQLSTVTRAFTVCFRVSHPDQRSEFDYELIREVHP